MRREVVHGVHSMHSMECMHRRIDYAAVVRGRWYSRGNDQSEKTRDMLGDSVDRAEKH